MESSPNETDPLLPRAPTAVGKPSLLWLSPVVALASICRGISMFARYEHYQRTYCPEYPSNPYPIACGRFVKWLELPSITVYMELWTMFAAFLVSFIAVGWWSALGDRRSRRLVLFCSILGAVVGDLSYLIVAATSPSRDDSRDLLSLGLIIEGLLGGFVVYNGAIHAYAFDVATSPLSRTVLFGVIDAISLVGFIVGAVIGKSTDLTLAYILAILLALLNLAFIYALLPESLNQQQDLMAPAIPQRSILKSIVSPISVFYRGPNSSKYLPLFALAFYVYSLTSAMDTGISSYLWQDLLPRLPRWFLITAPRAITLTTLLCILPTLAWFFKRKHGGSTERAGLQLATTLSHHAILAAAVSSIGVLVFCLHAYPYSRGLLYPLFTITYSFTAVARPALYALGASYLVALGRKGQIGEFFGALSVWGALAEYVSYSIYGIGSQIFGWSAFFLVITLMLLLPDPPPVIEEEESPQAEIEADDV
ncbi:hypothetical protein C8F04DRAFT_1137977 [Mycena alexandri]|uniref:MFS general substrate transporter n=1 Tax=Mycena alexandri TaxID=1745969 RepID=A0AAD6S8B2_9AGAR|nr:hypothetical protein C8F04DRAFT_1137977 [Mycena alexandri]